MISPRIASVTDDLSINQFQELMTYLYNAGLTISIRNIKAWRTTKNLTVDIS